MISDHTPVPVPPLLLLAPLCDGVLVTLIHPESESPDDEEEDDAAGCCSGPPTLSISTSALGFCDLASDLRGVSCSFWACCWWSSSSG